MKRAVASLLLICICSFWLVMPVMAQNASDLGNIEETPQPRFTYISSTGTNIGISNGKVTVSGSVSCYSNATSCKAVVYLQRREIGTTTWYNKAIFTEYGVRYCMASGTRTANVGYEYRAKAVYTVNDGAEQTTAYSRIAQCTSSTP